MVCPWFQHQRPSLLLPCSQPVASGRASGLIASAYELMSRWTVLVYVEGSEIRNQPGKPHARYCSRRCERTVRLFKMWQPARLEAAGRKCTTSTARANTIPYLLHNECPVMGLFFPWRRSRPRSWPVNSGDEKFLLLIGSKCKVWIYIQENYGANIITAYGCNTTLPQREEVQTFLAWLCSIYTTDTAVL